MHVSVVVATWNNCHQLAVGLEALSRCVVPSHLGWEVVLVNNNCTDETEKVARGFRDKLRLVYVEEPRQGLSRAKNAGIGASSGRLLVFADDMRPCPEWIETYWVAYEGKPTTGRARPTPFG